MNQKMHQRGLWTLDELSTADAQTLLTTARVLRQAQAPGLPLKGKHVAVLDDLPATGEADVFTSAALGLGAQVTRIPPGTLRLAGRADRRDTGRVLGRLYDAIECDGLGQVLMLELKSTAAIPVSNVLAPGRHPTRMLADLMTLQQSASCPIDEITICVAGDADSPWAIAWRQFAAVTGVGVIAGAASGMTPGPGRYLFDPAGELCADGQPAMRAMDGTGRSGESLGPEQVANHRFVVQALLAQTIE